MIGLFFRKWLQKDEKIYFFALVFSTMTVSLKKDPSLRVDLMERFCSFLDLSDDSKKIFLIRTQEILNAYYKNDIDINDLVTKIRHILNQHPRWINKLSLEAIASCVVKEEILQRRFVEFLLSSLRDAQG